MNVPSTSSSLEPSVVFRPDQALLSWISELAPYGILVTDRTLTIRSWNKWLAEQTSIEAGHVVGRPLEEAFPELGERRLIRHYLRALEGEVIVLSTALHGWLLTIRSTMRSAEAPNMLQTVRIAPLHDKGNIVGTITLIEDVTQREVQAKRLFRQQGLDRFLTQSLAALLQSADPIREIAAILPGAAPLLGVDVFLFYTFDPISKLLRLHSGAGLPPQTKEAFATIPVSDNPAISSGDGVLEATIRNHLAALQQLGLPQYCAFPLAVNDRVSGLLSFASYDSSRMDQENRSILARIARYAAVTIDRFLREREAVAASRAKDDFLAALSHELRAPLNALLLVASDSGTREDYPADVRDDFQFIARNAQLEARLIDDLLDLTRIERGKVLLEIRTVDVHQVIREAAMAVEADVSARKLRLRFDLRADPSSIAADEVRIQQVFWNVLKNATKFTPDNGAIMVSSVVQSGHLVVEVADTGIGMEPHELHRIFDAFSQGDHAQPGGAHRFGGLGLGLAISRKLVELHGGTIEATSAGKGLGSTFRIALPIKRTLSGGTDTSNGDPRRSPHVGPTSLKLLVVDDHPSTRETLERLLARRSHTIRTAETAAAALVAAASDRFDLVISDVGLPDMSGNELMRLLHERHGLPGIAVSGFGRDEDIERSRNAGFVAHLTKPVQLDALDAAIATWLASRSTEAEQSDGSIVDQGS